MNLSQIIKNGVSNALLEATGIPGFRVYASVGKKVVADMPDVYDNDVNDLIKFLKTTNKGAKITVEYKGKAIRTVK